MGLYDFKPQDIIHASEMNNHTPKKREKVIDKVVSDIVGKDILANDPRLIKLIVKWKTEKGNDSLDDKFLEDPKKIEELKQTFNV